MAQYLSDIFLTMRHDMRHYITLFLFLTSFFTLAQDKAVALVGGVLHLGNGTVLENHHIILQKDKIKTITQDQPSQETYNIIDIRGKHVYPGLILAPSILGLSEISAVPATLDYEEIGDYNPNVRSIVAFNSDSKIIPTFVFNGVLAAQIIPTGGILMGTSSIVALDGWNWEDMAIRMDDAIHLSWPKEYLPPRWWLGETEMRLNKNYKKTLDELNELFRKAAVKATTSQNKTGEAVDTKLAAMKGLFTGKLSLFIYAYSAKQIIESVQFAKNMGVKKVVLSGGHDADKVIPFLKDQNVPVFVSTTHRLPSRVDEDIDKPFTLPKTLMDAGVLTALAFDEGDIGSGRNIPFMAGQLISHGLDKEKALQMITSNAAKILGLDNWGTLEEGKVASFFVSDGDALDMRSNNIQYVFIRGKSVKVGGEQQALYEKYKERYAK